MLVGCQIIIVRKGFTMPAIPASIAQIRGGQGIIGVQGNAVRLETANAALLQKLGDSWQEALAEEHAWDLVEVLIPESQLQH